MPQVDDSQSGGGLQSSASDSESAAVNLLRTENAGAVGEADRPELRVFISSPSDVRPERLIAERVLKRLDREFRSYVRVKGVMWEHEPLLATHHFQTMITPPHDTNIVIVILWSTLGSLLPANEFSGPISLKSVTGTEWEFEDAVKSYRAFQRPKVLMYRKTLKVTGVLNDRHAVRQRLDQMDEVETFFKKWFVSEDSVLPSNASRQFDDAAEFEEMLEKHLHELIKLHVDTSGGTQTHVRRNYHENPFRGLLSFELRDTGIFFGRTRARNELRELLARQAERGSAFVLVFGASGSGKSSLVKAGLLADLVLPGMIGRVALVRHTTLRPADRDGALVEALAAAIIEPKEALPELRAPPLHENVETLAALLREAPAQVARPIRQGLAIGEQAASLGTTAESRLVIVIDQLEELFTHDKIKPSEREAFIAALKALAESGFVWVIATMRSDFFDRLESLPALAKLSDGEGRFLLLPPNTAEVAQIIRQPAREAGLEYEPDPLTGIALDEIIRHDAVGDATGAPIHSEPVSQISGSEIRRQAADGELPLLSFVLDQLWRRRSKSGLLTFGAYRELGGLKGAIGRRAEEVFIAQPVEVQNEFVSVLRELVTVTAGTATARSSALANFPEKTPARALVDALLDKDARLLVVDGDSAGSHVRLAHEALLTHWPRARDQVAAEARDLELRGRLEQEAEYWRAAPPRDKRSLVLADGLPLTEALALKARWGASLPTKVTEFVDASQRAVRHRHILRVVSHAGAVATLPLIAALIWAGWVWTSVRSVEAEMAFVTIPSGCFTMGSPQSDDERYPNEGVDGTVPGFCIKSFDFGKYEVTQKEWQQVMLFNPSSFTGNLQNPVEEVSWTEARWFVALMSFFGRHHYRLASETEWEYAARGHTTPQQYTKSYWGDQIEDGCSYENIPDLSFHAAGYRDYRYANCKDGFPYTAPVGKFKPNPFGLYDILGNVAEWVEDCYVEDLRKLPRDGSSATQGDCNKRVLRGGSWGEYSHVRAADRVVVQPSHSDNFYGFRIVRSP